MRIKLIFALFIFGTIGSKCEPFTVDSEKNETTGSDPIVSFCEADLGVTPLWHLWSER